jgi:tetratricopeptide (TPR) repeat protein
VASTPLLVEYFDRLPILTLGDDEEQWAAGARETMHLFRQDVKDRYNEGTLQRLLHSTDARTRQAAVLAIGLLGTYDSNAHVAALLHDEDPLVQRFASDALWELWFRGGTPDQNWSLQQAVRKPDNKSVRAALDALIARAPQFAKAYNQRAVWFFKAGEYQRAVRDCETVLQMNPYHFGAAAGLGQCYLKMKKPRAALRAFRQAVEINPTFDHLNETILALERALEKE